MPHPKSTVVRLFLVLVCQIRLGSGVAVLCKMGDIFVRSIAGADGNAQPIDVHRDSKRPNGFYAQLDYAMTSFDVDATGSPPDSCVVKRLPTSATTVDPGSSVLLTVTVVNLQDPTQASDYIMNVTRLQGQETYLAAVDIRDAYIVPGFDPLVRNYTAYLDLARDTVRFYYQRLDNGQVVGLVAHMETPGRRLSEESLKGRRSLYELPLGARNDSDLASGLLVRGSRANYAASSGVLFRGRRLLDPSLQPPVGEVQYQGQSYETTIDVGRKRNVLLVVTSADRSTVDHYEFVVQRPGCPSERRFFDGRKKVCTDVCNEGHFGNVETGRCTVCRDPLCMVCDARGVCETCLEGKVVIAGKCVVQKMGVEREAIEIENYGKRNWRMMAAGGATVCLFMLVCCIFPCVAGGGARRSLGSRQKPQRHSEEDDDGEMSAFIYDGE